MTIQLKPKLAYALLSHIDNEDESHNEQALKPAIEKQLGMSVTEQDFLGHLDYLNQQGFVQARFTGDAYGNQGPNPLPALISLKDAQMTESGRSLLAKLEQEIQMMASRQSNSAIATENLAFLEKIMAQADLPDIFDARDITEVIFRTMRDMIPNEISNATAEELHTPASSSNESISEEIADLWSDTNPIVSLISKIRQPLNIDAELFMRRIRQEGSVPKHIEVERILSSVFSATKAEISFAQAESIGGYLPGKIQHLWQDA